MNGSENKGDDGKMNGGDTDDASRPPSPSPPSPSSLPAVLPVGDYDFDLPPESIAQRPVTPRDAARLLHLPRHPGNSADNSAVDDGAPLRLTDALVADLPSFLRPGDLLVRNDTRVIPARLLGRRAGGGKTELLLIHPLDDDGDGDGDGAGAGVDLPSLGDLPIDETVWSTLTDDFARAAAPLHSSIPPAGDAVPAGAQRTGRKRWLCLARPSSHLRPGGILRFDAGGTVWPAIVEAKPGGGKVVVSFPVPAGGSFDAWLARAGRIPLPPYIRRNADGPDAADRERYQTHYASRSGAVAAPTAGLHFTPELDAALTAAGVGLATITLHVGPGTFRPVAADDMTRHKLDAEYYEVPPATVAAIKKTKADGGRIIAVGTTAARSLESMAARDGDDGASSGWTTLYILPGYRWRLVDGLLTNFHLPRSTLLALVAALAGRMRVLAAYRHAVAAGYRFYSYGDAMLVL